MKAIDSACSMHDIVPTTAHFGLVCLELGTQLVGMLHVKLNDVYAFILQIFPAACATNTSPNVKAKTKSFFDDKTANKATGSGNKDFMFHSTIGLQSYDLFSTKRLFVHFFLFFDS
jgi:hypothetical protein